MGWLDRQSFLGADSEQILGQAKIGLAGLGGGGSHVAQQFAHIGIGSFVICDPDVIEDTNLNRLVGGTWADVEWKAAKVDIAKRLIQGVRPDARVDVERGSWQEAMLKLRDCDVIVGGLDSARAKDELDGFSRRFLIPYIDMGMDVHQLGGDKHLIAGQVVLSTAGNPCLRCLGIVTEEMLAQEARNYGAAGGKPQVVWPNGVLASTAVGLAVQILTSWHHPAPEFAYLEYDGNLGTVRSSDLLRHVPSVCPHHPAVERGDPGFDIRRVIAAGSTSSPAPTPAQQNLLTKLLKFLTFGLGPNKT